MRALGIGLIVGGVASIVGVAWFLRARDGDAHEKGRSGRGAGSTVVQPTANEARASEVPNAPTNEATISADPSNASPSWSMPDVPGEPLVITGHITSADSGAPIANAEVTVDRLFRDAVRSDVDGKYQLTLDKLENYELRIEARAPGFGRREHRCDEFKDATLTVDLELRPSRRASGRILAEDGTPIAQVEVSAHASVQGTEGDMRDEVQARTLDDGTFLLADLRPDLPHVLRLRKHGFGTLTFSFPADEKAEPETKFPEIVLPPAAALSGLVADDGGVPIEDANVELHGGNTDWLRFSTVEPTYTSLDLWHLRVVSDAMGRFRFEDLAPGSYDVHAYVKGHAPQQPIRCTISPGETPSELTFTFARGLSIEGRVLDDSGRPAANTWIELEFEPQSHWGMAAVSDRQGRFRFFGLEAGSYRLFQEGSAFESYDSRERRGVQVEAGTQDVVVTIHSIPMDTIRGKVVDQDGHPVACAWIRAFLESGMGFSVESRVGGRFALNVPRGATVKLLACPREYWPQTVDGHYDLSRAKVASAADGEVSLSFQDWDDDH